MKEKKDSELITRFTLFLPKDLSIDSMSQVKKVKLPYVIIGTLFCLVSFFLLGVGLVFQRIYLLALLLFLTTMVFVASLFFTKKGKFKIGSYINSVGLLMGCAAVLFFAPFYPTTTILYRDAFFAVVMALLNQAVSIKKRQLKHFFHIELLMWIVSVALIFKPLMAVSRVDFFVAVIVNTLALIFCNLLIMLNNLLDFRITSKVEENEKQMKEHLEKILTVVKESDEGLNIGQQLMEYAESASTSLSKVEDFSRYMIKESNTLSSETSSVKNSGEEIAEQAVNMRMSVQTQADSITRTSEEMKQMSSNIDSLNKIASTQKVEMDRIVSSLESQRKLLVEIVQHVDNVKESSEGISSFVNTIDDISSQTGLLAMNASIEAAHAGTYGKGFSVIAQEIRKLSEETNSSASKISENLKDNLSVVKNATDAVSRFAQYMEKSATDMRTTLNSIEEMISGISEINSGVQNIMESLNGIVCESENSSGMVDTVAEKIQVQKASLEKISGFTGAVTERANGLEGILMDIQVAIAMIQRYATENSIVGERISKSLEA
ncbi:MAG: hypothetical protein IKQ43_07670 [Treponema sp.]|nr:hypothetical protein [Treponema sp.]